MRRPGAAALAASILAGALGHAAWAQAQAASPFPEVPAPQGAAVSYTGAYLTLGAGALLVASSFVFESEADHRYREYLRATDPQAIESLYDQTVRYDKLSTASLILGEGLLVAGIYFRFLHTPPASRLQLAVGPSRCALSWRF